MRKSIDKFQDMKLTDLGDSVIWIAGSLYVKTETAMKQLITELKTIGYEVELSEHGTDHWFAKLPDLSRGKCDSCGELISTFGIRSHGHKCEKCGEVTYWKIVDGTVIRFVFIEHDENKESPGMIDISMVAKYWDTEAGYVYFYPLLSGGFWTSAERAQAYFDDNSDKWELVEKDGVELIKMRYTQPWDYDICAFEPMDISSHHTKTSNHSIVKIWKGVEYGEWSMDFPMPETIGLYGTWKWMPLAASPKIHEEIMHAAGQVSRKDYYYQDGRPFFIDVHWENMSTYIRHFTELDADAFDKAWPRFRRDGPGGIDDLAAWCHPEAEVRNDPNIGSLLVGFGKVLSGEHLEPGEVDAMQLAAADEEVFDTFAAAVGYKGGRRRQRWLESDLKDNKLVE